MGSELGSDQTAVNLPGQFQCVNRFSALFWEKRWDHQEPLDLLLLRPYRHCELLFVFLHGYLTLDNSSAIRRIEIRFGGCMRLQISALGRDLSGSYTLPTQYVPILQPSE